MVDIFSSKRLVYVPIEKDEKLNAFMHELERDPAAVNASSHLPSGVTREATNDRIDTLKKRALLHMYICLPPGSPDFAPSTAVETDPSKSSLPSPTPIGTICLTRGPDTWTHHAHSEIGITLASPYHGKGYGSEAIRWVLWWGFSVARLHRIQIGCVGWNFGAFRLYKRLGFKHEATLRQCHWFMGTYHDVHLLGMLEDEWRALRPCEGRGDWGRAEDGEGTGKEGQPMTSEEVAKIMGCA